MTRDELYALTSYSNWTLGRPIDAADANGLYACAGCGGLTRHEHSHGLCARCAATRRPSGEVIDLRKAKGWK